MVQQQQAQNRNLKVTENEESNGNVSRLVPAVTTKAIDEESDINISKSVPKVINKATNVRTFENNNNQLPPNTNLQPVANHLQPPNYVLNHEYNRNKFEQHRANIRKFKEYHQRLQTPSSWLDRFQNFLISTGQVLTQTLG